MVRQITNHPSINHATYFLQSSFMPDGRNILFTSYRTGTPQLFLAPFPESEKGDAEQLTFGAAIHPYSAAIRNEYVFFVRGGEIRRYRFDTRTEDLIVSFDGQLGEVSPDR